MTDISVLSQFTHSAFVADCDPMVEDSWRKHSTPTAPILNHFLYLRFLYGEILTFSRFLPSSRSVAVDEVPYTLDILDVATSEEYWVAPMREASGFCLVYSCSSLASFEALSHLVQLIKDRDTTLKIDPMVIVESKSDLDASERQVSSEDGRAFARFLGCPFLQCSAKTGENVTEVFQAITRTIVAMTPATNTAQGGARNVRNCIIL